MKLYGYYRSSAAYRVRIAINIKKVSYCSEIVNLREGKQYGEQWLAMNPQGLVPVLETQEGARIAQSMAIIEWLEESYPEPSLLPGNALQRAQVRSLSGQIGCDIHPLDNLRVLKYLENQLGIEQEARMHWYHHWIKQGFDAFESQLTGGCFCVGDTPTLADAFLIPQVYNALRFNVDLAPYPKIQMIYEHCLSLSAFAAAAPELQHDAL